MDFDHPQYRLISARLRSFADWPRNKKQCPRELSMAGFFYTGSSDHVKCFSCGGGLRDWEDSDVPWEQHALWLSNCSFLKSRKGKSYIQNVKDKFSSQTQSNQFQNKDPDEDKLCKICYVNEYEMLFIPCGHIVACATCVRSINKCPVCRRLILETIRAYFS